MWTLTLAPDADGYNSTDGEETIHVKLDGGQSRFRRDKIGSTKTVQVKWTLNPAQYEYWRTFYVSGTQKGALPFLCPLVSEDGNGPELHVCNFMPGSVSLPTQQGLTYVQQATLEVIPLPRDEAADLIELAMYEFADQEEVFYGLYHLVNVTFPENLSA